MQALLEKMMQEGVKEGCFPGGTAAVGCGGRVLASTAVGRISLPDGAETTLQTRYDMASCTKIMGATMLALRALEEGELTLDDTIGRFLPAPEDRKDITIRQLMTHTSGIVPEIRLDLSGRPPKDALEVILSHPLAGAPGVPRYTCMGYIVLGKLLEALYGAPLNVLAEEKVFKPLHMAHTGYCPTGDNFAATEVDPSTGKAWQGVVHDENARYLGGVSANAGIFSDIKDCTLFAQMLAAMGGDYLTRATMRKATHNYTPGFDVHRGLGFHLAGTPCNYLGDLLPETAFGHTGFTGTSFAIEPETGFFVVLLTNRVHPTRENGKQLRFRRAAHNALYAAFLRGAK